MTFDGSAYERQQNERARQVAEKLRELVPLDWGVGPAIAFECPRGHSLKRYRVQEYDDSLVLVALPGEARKSGATARNGSPWTGQRSPCESQGCPNSVTGRRYCDEHGGRAVEDVHLVRTEFTCRCGWRDVFTMARLLEVYGAAVALKLDSVPITFATRSVRTKR